MSRLQGLIGLFANTPVKDALLESYRRGLAWNPAYPNLHGLDESRIRKMTGYESDAQLLLKSLQESDQNLGVLTEAFHGRAPIFDGIFGPATQALISIRRCPMPDFAPPAGARFTYEDPGLQRAVETMQLRAQFIEQNRDNALAGSGSWPSCDPSQPGVHSLRVRIDPARTPSTVLAYRQKALDAVIQAYREVGCGLRYIHDATSDCEIAKRFEALSGSVIGWNEFPYPNTCNQTIDGRLDTGYAPSDYRYWANLEAHETGHGVGLEHTRGGIMNPSILLIWPLTWKGGPSEAAMNRYFGGKPIGVPEPPPPPTPTPINVTFRGTIEALANGNPVGRFQLTPSQQ